MQSKLINPSVKKQMKDTFFDSTRLRFLFCSQFLAEERKEERDTSERSREKRESHKSQAELP